MVALESCVDREIFIHAAWYPPLMVSSNPLINNKLWCLALAGNLLVYFTDAEGYRQKEVLYGRVHGDDTEFFFIPGVTVAISDLSTAHRLGLAQHYNLFPGRAISQGRSQAKADLRTSDFVPHNTKRYDLDVVNKTRIFRVKDGETSEYVADVPDSIEGGKCFDNIRQREYVNGQVYKDPPGKVIWELQQICAGGFSALRPSTNMSVLDGVYLGSRVHRNVFFRFRNGEVKEAELSLKEINEQEEYYVTYYPLCDGVIAVVVPTLRSPTEKISPYVILRKSRENKKRSWSLFSWWKERRAQTGAAAGHEQAGLLAGDDESNALCGGKHIRRRLAGDELMFWDRGLPKEFNLKPLYQVE